MDSIEMNEFQELILSQVETLDQELGRGAYGRVYKIKYCEKICAAKEAHLILVEGEAQQTIQSFLRECQRCSKLRHPNIVQFLGVYFPEDDTAKLRLPAMVMELMESNLASFVSKAKGRIPVDVKFSIISDVAYGLCYLHNQKDPIVHRDLSSNNVLLARQGNTAKIGDFGVSKVMQAGRKNTTGPGHIDFMPPEALMAGPDYDCSLDVFSFAGIVLHTYSQLWPIPSNAVNFDPKTRKLVPLSEVDRRVKYLDLMTGEGAALRPLVEQCLDMDPTVRPSIKSICEKIMRKDTTCTSIVPICKKKYHVVTKEKNIVELYKEICQLDDSPEDPDDYDRDKALVYRLIPDSKVEIAQGVFEQTYGSKLVQQKELLPEKAVILVGATGKGKSTLINRMINYIFGVKCHDEFRFQLIVEKESSQTESQTKDITKYIVYKSHLHFKLIIIDTPGFGDTAGKQEDRMTVEKIKNLFKSDAVVSIDAICFVANYNDQRLTDYCSYVFTSIAHMFGVDVKRNVCIMATFCDSAYDAKRYIKPAPTLKCIKKAGIPFECSFPFSNKDIYIKPEHRIDVNHWETSEISFDLFFEELDRTLAVSLKLSRDILEKQHIILHAQLPDLVRKLKNNIHIIHEHKQDLKAIEEDLKNPNEKLFTSKVRVEKEVMQNIEEPNTFCTRCEKCNRVCHYPCNIKDDTDLWWCDTISWFNLDFYFYCTVCPDKCSWKYHKRYNQRPVRQTTTEFRTSDFLKRKYLQVKGHEKDSLMKLCEEKIVSAYGDLLKDLEGIQECINFLNTQCLCDVPVTLEQYINDIIENERKVKEDGYLKRMTVLEHLVITMRNTDIFKAFEQGSKEDRLCQAKQCYKDITD